MKILLITPRFHTNLYYRVIALQNAGCKVKVVVLYKGKSEYYENIDIQQIGLSFTSKIFLKLIALFKKNYLQTQLEMRLQSPNRQLKQIIKTFKPDVILLKAYQNILAIKTLILAKRYKAKVLMFTQTTLTHIKGSKLLFKWNIKLFKYLKVSAYITPIKDNYDAFKNFGIDNVFYLPFVFPASYKNKNKISHKDKPVKIISVGKFVKRKSHLLLVQACNELIKQGVLLRLNIYGENPNNQYYNETIDYIKRHSLEQYININTNISYPKIVSEYGNNDIFIMPSYDEPAAYSPVEALCNALPVICSTQNGSKCYIEAGINGYIFEAKNLSDLIDKIKLAITGDNLQKLSANALITAKKNHNLESFAKGVFDIELI